MKEIQHFSSQVDNMTLKTVEHKHKSARLLQIALVILAIFLIIGFISRYITSTGSESGNSLSVPTANSTSVDGSLQFASWPIQLSVAQQAAKQVDPEAVVSFVNAEPIEEDLSAFEVEIGFLRPSGPTRSSSLGESVAEMLVSFQDDALTSTLKVDALYDYAGPIPTAEQRRNSAELIASLQLGPREALQKTKEAETKTGIPTQDKIKPQIALLMGDEVPINISSPAVWSIRYSGEKHARFFYVDAQTGQVLFQGESNY